MKIVKLSSENVLRLNAVEITPDGNLIVIGGENEQGKTSVLDSIVLAMGGRAAKHTKPLKDGAKKGKAVIELDDGLKVTRTFTEAGGGTLKVENKDGAVYPSPQAMLDNLVGQLTFDPLAWSKMDGKKQLDILKAMVGLDFSKLDEKRGQLYSTRASVNQEVKRLKGAIDSMPHYPDAPEKEILVADLMKELSDRQKTNKSNDAERNKLDLLKRDGTEIDREIEAIQGKIDALKKELERLESEGDAIDLAVAEQSKTVRAIKDADEQEIKTKIETAESVNAKLRSNNSRAEKETELKAVEEKSKNLTRQIENIDIEKETALSKAKFPVDGLSFDESGVTYKNIPFEQASSAERLRVSVAMGVAMNPKLKVLLIRDGSLLDEKNLEMIAKMADESGHQIWLERVGKGKECSVIIEDGGVQK